MTVRRIISRARLPISLLLALVIAAPVFAASAPLPSWEQLSAAQREQLIAPIRERWNAEPERRQQLLERARRWQQMTPDQRRRAHRGMKRWEHLSAEQRTQARALFVRMRSLDPEARVAFKAKWRAMTPEQQAAWLEANPAAAGREHRRPPPR